MFKGRGSGASELQPRPVGVITEGRSAAFFSNPSKFGCATSLPRIAQKLSFLLDSRDFGLWPERELYFVVSWSADGQIAAVGTWCDLPPRVERIAPLTGANRSTRPPREDGGRLGPGFTTARKDILKN